MFTNPPPLILICGLVTGLFVEGEYVLTFLLVSVLKAFHPINGGGFQNPMVSPLWCLRVRDRAFAQIAVINVS